MKKSLIHLILFFMICVNCGFSQLPRDTIMPADMGMFVLHNKKSYHLYNQPGSVGVKFMLSKDTTVIQKNIDRFFINSFEYDSVNNLLYILSNKQIEGKYRSDLLVFDFNNEKLFTYKTYEDYEGQLVSNGKAYFANKKNGKLMIYDYLVDNKRFTNINKFPGLQQDYEITGLICLNDLQLLVSTGIFNGEFHEDLQYHLVNTKDFKNFRVHPEADLSLVLKDWGFSLLFYDIPKKYAFCLDGIIDSEYKYFSGFLTKSFGVRGFEIEKNEIAQLIISTETDEIGRNRRPTMVLIPYTPCPYIEKTMYRIYHNEQISKNDLSRFDAFELKLIRNMVYAKHNYGFNSDFLTAYFNLYNFYSAGRFSRTKDINHLLTEADKANITLIRAAEERAKQ